MIIDLVDFQNFDSSNNLGSGVLTFPDLAVRAIAHGLTHEIIVPKAFIVLHDETTFIKLNILRVDDSFVFFLFFALIVFGLS